MSRLPFLRTWLRTRNAIVLHLSNGTIQVKNNLNKTYITDSNSSDFFFHACTSLISELHA